MQSNHALLTEPIRYMHNWINCATAKKNASFFLRFVRWVRHANPIKMISKHLHEYRSTQCERKHGKIGIKWKNCIYLFRALELDDVSIHNQRTLNFEIKLHQTLHFAFDFFSPSNVFPLVQHSSGGVTLMFIYNLHRIQKNWKCALSVSAFP